MGRLISTDGKPFTLLVCGDREWKNSKRILEILEPFVGEIKLLIHGNCRGADRIADSIARSLNIPRRPFSADWLQYGHAAGSIRNQRMAQEKPDIVFAFHNNIQKSKGTKDMLSKASNAERWLFTDKEIFTVEEVSRGVVYVKKASPISCKKEEKED